MTKARAEFVGAASGMLAVITVTAASSPCFAQGQQYPYTIIHGLDPAALQQLDIPKKKAPDSFVLPEVPTLKRDLGLPGVKEASFLIKKIEISESNLLTGEELKALKAPYLNRYLTASDAVALRDGITLALVKKGYINSGVVIPDQDVSDGVLRFKIVEGRLVAGGKLKTSTNAGQEGRLPAAYAEQRLGINSGAPLNVDILKARYQSLLEDRNIERVSAELRPGNLPGEAVLDIDIVEKPRRSWTTFVQNDRSAAVGEIRAGLSGIGRTVWRPGDQVDAEVSLTQALAEGRINYSVPLTATNIMLDGALSGSNGHIIEAPLNDLDATSQSFAQSLGVTWPLISAPGQALRLSTSVDHVRVRTELMGKGFSFSPGAVNGVTDYSTFRTGLSYTFFSNYRAIGVSVSVAHGLKGPAINGDVGAGNFWSANAAAQYVQRLSDTGGKLILRGQLQFSGQPLYATEKLAIGGTTTVRGFRQNLALGDRGYIFSVEYQMSLSHLLKRLPGKQFTFADRVQVSVFADTGRAIDAASPTTSSQSLSSAGLRCAWQVTDKVSVDLAYAHAFNAVSKAHSLSDDGWTFAIKRSF